MDDLRLILILAGLAILGLIWVLHRPDGSSKRPGASRREDRRREPNLGPPPGAETEDDIGDDEAEAAWPQQTTLPDMGSEAPASASEDEPVARRRPGETEVPPDDEWRDPEPVRRAASAETLSPQADSPVIVTLYVRARGDRNISGLSLLDAAIKAGLRFGEMKIFHRRHRGEPQRARRVTEQVAEIVIDPFEMIDVGDGKKQLVIVAQRPLLLGRKLIDE